MSEIVYAKIGGQIAWSGGEMTLRVGMSASVDHPLVKERPDLFTDIAPAPDLPAPPRVERATAAPGEMRVAPAAKKAAPAKKTV